MAISSILRSNFEFDFFIKQDNFGITFCKYSIFVLIRLANRLQIIVMLLQKSVLLCLSGMRFHKIGRCLTKLLFKTIRKISRIGKTGEIGNFRDSGCILR